MFSDEDLRLLDPTGAVILDNTWTDFNGIQIGGLTSGNVLKYRRYRENKPERYPYISSKICSVKARPDLPWLDRFEEREGYKLLLCHHPEYRDEYLKEKNIDLIVCGHAHGGQIRLFGQGLYAPGQGIFPKYTSGFYGNMFVSRGLANTGWPIPRLFNRRQIVYLHFSEQ